MNKKILFSILASLILISGCGKLNNEIKEGSKVTISYSAHFEDGSVFKDQEKLSFTVGKSETFKIIEDSLIGLKQGDEKEILISPENGYGKDYDQYKVQKISKIIFDRLAMIPEIGKKYKIGNLEGIIKSSEGDGDYKMYMLDSNPRETYENLAFKIKIEKIE